MISDHVPTAFGVLVVLAALAAPAGAAEAIAERPALPTPGNAAEAQNILGAKLLVCNTCHGANGAPKNANVPIIWGLQENYLLKELHDFQSGGRDNEVMHWMATALTAEELGSAAAAVCQVCHQQNFVGGVPAPRLAGQRYEYLVETMRRFAEGERTNNADMANMMKAMSAADREALARYISGL